MTEFKTLFYNARTGVQFVLVWKDEEHYRAGRVFLDKLTGGAYLGEGESTDTYILETEQQYDALFEFRRELELNSGTEE